MSKDKAIEQVQGAELCIEVKDYLRMVNSLQQKTQKLVEQALGHWPENAELQRKSAYLRARDKEHYSQPPEQGKSAQPDGAQ